MPPSPSPSPSPSLRWRSSRSPSLSNLSEHASQDEEERLENVRPQSTAATDISLRTPKRKLQTKSRQSPTSQIASFLTMHEPSSKALDAYRKANEPSSTPGSRSRPVASPVAPTQLPAHIPSVASKWNGLPSSTRVPIPPRRSSSKSTSVDSPRNASSRAQRNRRNDCEQPSVSTLRSSSSLDRVQRSSQKVLLTTGSEPMQKRGFGTPRIRREDATAEYLRLRPAIDRIKAGPYRSTCDALGQGAHQQEPHAQRQSSRQSLRGPGVSRPQPADQNHRPSPQIKRLCESPPGSDGVEDFHASMAGRSFLHSPTPPASPTISEMSTDDHRALGHDCTLSQLSQLDEQEEVQHETNVEGQSGSSAWSQCSGFPKLTSAAGFPDALDTVSEASSPTTPRSPELMPKVESEPGISWIDSWEEGIADREMRQSFESCPLGAEARPEEDVYPAAKNSVTALSTDYQNRSFNFASSTTLAGEDIAMDHPISNNRWSHVLPLESRADSVMCASSLAISDKGSRASLRHSLISVSTDAETNSLMSRRTRDSMKRRSATFLSSPQSLSARAAKVLSQTLVMEPTSEDNESFSTASEGHSEDEQPAPKPTKGSRQSLYHQYLGKTDTINCGAVKKGADPDITVIDVAELANCGLAESSGGIHGRGSITDAKKATRLSDASALTVTSSPGSAVATSRSLAEEPHYGTVDRSPRGSSMLTLGENEPAISPSAVPSIHVRNSSRSSIVSAASSAAEPPPPIRRQPSDEGSSRVSAARRSWFRSGANGENDADRCARSSAISNVQCSAFSAFNFEALSEDYSSSDDNEEFLYTLDEDSDDQSDDLDMQDDLELSDDADQANSCEPYPPARVSVSVPDIRARASMRGQSEATTSGERQLQQPHQQPRRESKEMSKLRLGLGGNIRKDAEMDRAPWEAWDYFLSDSSKDDRALRKTKSQMLTRLSGSPSVPRPTSSKLPLSPSVQDIETGSGQTAYRPSKAERVLGARDVFRQKDDESSSVGSKKTLAAATAKISKRFTVRGLWAR